MRVIVFLYIRCASKCTMKRYCNSSSPIFKFILISFVLLLSSCSDRGEYSRPESLEEQIKELGTIGETNLSFESAVIDRVHFGLDSAELSTSAKSTLAAQAEWLKENKNKIGSIIIEGHCDERGTKDYNFALGEKRATAVKNYLVFAGLDAEKIKVISYGKEKPSVIGHDESSWMYNRRAVTVIAE